jgi:hypothetical protein
MNLFAWCQISISRDIKIKLETGGSAFDLQFRSGDLPSSWGWAGLATSRGHGCVRAWAVSAWRARWAAELGRRSGRRAWRRYSALFSAACSVAVLEGVLGGGSASRSRRRCSRACSAGVLGGILGSGARVRARRRCSRVCGAEAAWPARMVGDARRPGLLAWWAAPGALACSRGGLPPQLRSGELVCLPATSLCCFPAHVGARRRPRGGADSRWTAVGRRRPRGGAGDCRARLFVGDGSFLISRRD